MLRFLAFCFVLCTAGAGAAENPDQRAPLEPFQIADNLYYVGSRDLAAYLVTTAKGNILINANLATSPPQIRESVEKLGFRWSDTRILLNSQAHFDHVGGASEILRETGAQNLAMEGDADVIESGGRTDFLINSGSLQTFVPARVDRVLRDGDTVALGGVTLTAHKTAGHTRGCTTWTLRSHLPGEPPGKVRDIVIVGGVTFWGDYQFVERPERPESYPGIAADFRRTFATLRALPCDVFLGAHGAYFDLLPKLARRSSDVTSVWIDPDGYKTYVDQAERAFNTRFDQQLRERQIKPRRSTPSSASPP